LNATARNVLKLFIGTVGFLVLLIVIQAILNRHNRRIDLTPSKKFTLSTRTQQVFRDLNQEVRAIAFIDSDRPENFFVEDLLDRLVALSPHFSYKAVEINRNPALAREYQATQYGTLVFEANGQRRGTLLQNGEIGVVTALLQVTRTEPRTIYFLTGHGEGDITNQNPQEGYSKLNGVLANEFYHAEPLSLGANGTVPQEAAAVVVINPKAPFLPFEISALDAYVQRGGALFVLLDTNSTPSINPLLEQYGFRLPPLVAVDPAKRLYAGEIITYRVTPTSRPHQMIVSVNAPPIFSKARVVAVHTNADNGVLAKPVLSTSDQGWATDEQYLDKSGSATFVASRDVPGPILIASEIALRKQEAGEEVVGGRIVVFGDADFANNILIDQGGNKDLLVNAINWLAEDIGQIGARPETQKTGVNQFFMSEEQGRKILILSTVVMPTLVASVGLALFLWRRRNA
jgi:ABC-type uncharacterized transport system involved in gliding motility auxiliary subunit